MEYYFKNDTKLTNWYPNSPFTLPNGLRFTNSEAAFHSQKFLDVEIKKQFCDLDAESAKKHNWELSEHLRPDWESVKYDAMKEVAYAKFSQNPDCLEELLATGDAELVEDTTGWHDNTWGRCSCDACRNKPYKNYLGKILMEVRAELS